MCTDNPCVEYTEGRGKNKSVHLSIDVFMNVTVMLASNDSRSTCVIILTLSWLTDCKTGSHFFSHVRNKVTAVRMRCLWPDLPSQNATRKIINVIKER